MHASVHTYTTTGTLDGSYAGFWIEKAKQNILSSPFMKDTIAKAKNNFLGKFGRRHPRATDPVVMRRARQLRRSGINVITANVDQLFSTLRCGRRKSNRPCRQLPVNNSSMQPRELVLLFD